MANGDKSGRRIGVGTVAGAALAAVLLFGNCNRPQPAPANVGSSQASPITAEIISSEPAQMELSDAQVTYSPRDKLLNFRVKYRFTQGGPSKYYLCELAFPGTDNHGSKPMFSFDLKPEGILADGFRNIKQPVETFEIRVSEADSPQAGYRLISNIVSGKVETAAE
jgi:hypothetical protein